jgi:topoisomerase-4 subunit B
MKKKIEYNEDSIKTLNPLEHIRLRTGMYIGRIGDGSNPSDGIYVMLKEVIDNSIDEFIMGNGKKIEIKRDCQSITVRDYGRGIPLGKVVDCVSQINTGGKYNNDVFQFSVGLNGVGNKAVNALSEKFEVISYRDGKFHKATFERGKLITDISGEDKKSHSGTFIQFTPDPEIFNTYGWQEEYIINRLKYYSYLNSNLTIIYNGTPFNSKNGLSDLLISELGTELPIYDIIHCKTEKIEFAFTHTHSYGENYFSFVNGQYTNDGGTHQNAFREGILKGVNSFCKKNYAGEDVRDGIIGAISIKIQDPVFESQTKNKLGSTDVRTWIVPIIRDEIELWLHKNTDIADKLLEKIRNNERIRKELSSIKKEARERSKKINLRITKLIDCKIHYNELKNPRREETTLFLTEGDSAGGAMIQSRDVYTQAIFSLKGKPLNTFGFGREIIYKNEELYNIMQSLGIEDSLENLRYNKVVISTDQDVDGMHIRNLLITYFLTYFEELVLRGHLYVLKTPLFRVRNKKETIYCYNEKERDNASKKLKTYEITRFKGLGEISPKEFAQFIGPKAHIEQISINSIGDIKRILEFFMGKNTPERKNFIIKNLITEIT